MMPPIMASIVSIYGLVIAVIISNALKEKLALFTGFIQLGAGISVGVSGLATGYFGHNLPSRKRTTIQEKLTMPQVRNWDCG
jgi:F0F1-type ATP synthase membrane subunit c/vacuolar-type H+-ATPase subunit K